MVAVLLAACGAEDGDTSTPSTSDAPRAATWGIRTAVAHGHAAWTGQAGFVAHFEVKFGTKRILDHNVYVDTDGARTRFEAEDGAVFLYDGKRAWASAEASRDPLTGLHLQTWPALIAAPFTMDGHGEVATRRIDDEIYETAARDRFRYFVQPESHRLVALAYPATFGVPVPEARDMKTLVRFSEHEEVAGVLVPTQWAFWHWDPAPGQGVVGTDTKGLATLSGVKMLDRLDPELFVPADGMVEIQLP